MNVKLALDRIVEFEQEREKLRQQNKRKKEKVEEVEEMISPLHILEILNAKPKLKFMVIKQYLLNKLQIQDLEIRKNTVLVDKNVQKIKQTRDEIKQLRETTINFNMKKKQCDSCTDELTLPTIHFMCGHTFHDRCIPVDEKGQRLCEKCIGQYKSLLEQREQMNNLDEDAFNSELQSTAKRYHVVSNYYGKGLFTDLKFKEEEEGEEDSLL